MRFLFILFVLSVLISCKYSSTIKPKIENKREKIKSDTTYIVVDSASIDKTNNSFDYVLMLEQDKMKYIIHREKNQDSSLEFFVSTFYKDNQINLQQYKIIDLPTGLCRDILRDNNTKYFYITDWYDKQAAGDTLIKSTVDFINHFVLVRSLISSSNYKIKLNEIKY